MLKWGVYDFLCKKFLGMLKGWIGELGKGLINKGGLWRDEWKRDRRNSLLVLKVVGELLNKIVNRV
ncbi:hypothetical protein, partial [Priestia megaterium]|uniref:hypothetical protein n=1 Tax=Priestia megaterium TaxID=1404 RepID=UPI001C98F1D6